MTTERKKTSWTLFALFLMVGILIGTRISKFTERRISSGALETIKSVIISNYVDTVDISELNEVAIAAMVHSLDPHSAYLPAVETQVADEDLLGEFDGIGVQFRMIDDTLNIIQPISGGPSEKVGILAGDRIIAVEGETIAGVNMSTDDITKRLKGPKGTKVNIDVQRLGLTKLLNFDITRAAIPTYSIDVDFMVEPGIGYIKLSKFSATTAREIDQAIARLNESGMEKLILDLRRNGGGLLFEAISVADQFIPKDELIVYTEGLNRPVKKAFGTEYGLFEDKPVVVLIDEFSASASEIIAGSIQDNDRGIIVGRRSFGKGLVQEGIRLSNGASIRLTVARYHTPTGRCIQKPYVKGQTDVDEELLMRLTSGELLSLDSVKLDTTQKYETPKGRIVYGGGGIMPDVYVPYLSDTNLIYLNTLTNKGLILRFSFNYSNNNRQNLLKKYPDVDTFIKNYVVEEKMFRDLIAYAQSNGVKPDKEGINKYEDRIKMLLKAYIARDLFDDKGFYPIYLPADTDFVKAMEVIKNPDSFNF